MKTRWIINFLLLWLFIAACSSGEDKKPEAPDFASDVTAIESGLTPTLSIEGRPAQKFSLQERMQLYNVPGVSIAFFEDGKIQWTKTYGFLSKDSIHPVTPETRFQAASISKPVAASGMMTMVESGELSLTTPVNEYLGDWKIPENDFTRQQPVTLRHLVTHTGGLTVHGFRGYASDEPVPSTVQILEGLPPTNSAPIRVDTLPGLMMRYSGGGYTVMQYALETQLEESFPEFMEKNVLQPVGMSRSTYDQPLPENKQDNVAIGHRPAGEMVAGKWHTYPEMAAAGLWTTPSDLATWALAMQRAYNGSEDEFISSQTAQSILEKNDFDWGLGPGVMGAGDSLRFSHGGANEGYRCYLMGYAKEGGQGVAIMTNNDLGWPMIFELLRSFSTHYEWGIFDQTVITELPLSPEESAEYVGEYGIEDGITIQIYNEGAELYGKYNETLFTLYRTAPETFIDDIDLDELEFFRNEAGEVAGFTVEGTRFEKRNSNE